MQLLHYNDMVWNQTVIFQGRSGANQWKFSILIVLDHSNVGRSQPDQNTQYFIETGGHTIAETV